MAIWKPENIFITAKGQEMIDRAATGEGKIVITKARTSDQTYTPSAGGSKEDATALVSEKHECAFRQRPTVENSKGYILIVQLQSNENRIDGGTEAYDLEQLGAYAKYVVEDEDTGEDIIVIPETLLLYAEAEGGTADKIPSVEDAAVFAEYALQLNVFNPIIGDITVQTLNTGVLTHKEVIEDIQAYFEGDTSESYAELIHNHNIDFSKLTKQLGNVSLNSIEDGIYYFNSNTTNTPTTGSRGFVMQSTPAADGKKFQVAVKDSVKYAYIYYRYYDGSSWSTWYYTATSNHSHSDATQSASGFMSKSDKTKLDGIAEGAQVTKVTGVKGSNESAYREGDVNITKDNIGLGNVDNTSDVSKPVSTLQQAALDEKAPLASPTFTGSPNSTTPTSSDNSTRVATTAFVKSVLGGYLPFTKLTLSSTTKTTLSSIKTVGVYWLPHNAGISNSSNASFFTDFPSDVIGDMQDRGLSNEYGVMLIVELANNSSMSGQYYYQILRIRCSGRDDLVYTRTLYTKSSSSWKIISDAVGTTATTGTSDKTIATTAFVQQEVDSKVTSNIIFGTYTGDGNASQSINLGVEPIAVEVYRSDGVQALAWQGDTQPTYYGGLAIRGNSCTCVSITSTGFKVYTSGRTQGNNRDIVYYYKAYISGTLKE